MKSPNPNLQQGLQNFFGSGVSALPIAGIFEKALSRGGELAELFFEETDSTRVFFESGKVDKILEGQDTGVGLRILFDGRSVYGYTTDLSAEALMRLAGTLSFAVETQGLKLPAEDYRFAAQRDSAIQTYKIKRSPRELSLSGKIDIARRASDAARASLADARQITSILLDSRRRILVINSDGTISNDEKFYLHMYCQVVGEKDGRVESAMESEGGYLGLELFDQVTPEEIGKNAANRVKTLLSASPAPSGTLTVVLGAEAGGTMIHEAVGHGLEADLACNGLSVYQGKVGALVASPLITVVDDGTMPEKRGSFRFDDEGTPSQKTTLIENGKLKAYMVDRLSAMKFDLPATGNGRRESFRHKPIVRMTNTYIAPGPHDPKQILAETKEGIYVKAMGGGQVNTVTGDFVFAVTEGYLIREGKLAEPIRGATLVGNGPKVLSIVDRLGNDLGFATGTCGKDGQGAPVTDAQPTMRIPELTVGGEVPIETYFKKTGA